MPGRITRASRTHTKIRTPTTTRAGRSLLQTTPILNPRQLMIRSADQKKPRRLQQSVLVPIIVTEATLNDKINSQCLLRDQQRLLIIMKAGRIQRSSEDELMVGLPYTQRMIIGKRRGTSYGSCSVIRPTSSWSGWRNIRTNFYGQRCGWDPIDYGNYVKDVKTRRHLSEAGKAFSAFCHYMCVPLSSCIVSA